MVYPLSHAQHTLVLCEYPFSPNFLAMAGLLETLVVPRASALPSASVVPVVGSTSVRFSDFRGLKIQPTRSSVKLSSTRKARVGSRIVCEAQETAVEAPPAVSDSNWQSLVLECEQPVLVEFWAPWCGPCRMIHPVIDKLAKQYAGKLKVYKVNTDESPSIATQYGIRSIPTVIVFKNGEKKDAVIGAVPESTLTTCIEKFL